MNLALSGASSEDAGIGHPLDPRLERSDDVPVLPARHLVSHPLPVAVLALTSALVVLLVDPPGLKGVIAATLAAVVVVLGGIDLERGIIPNAIVLPAAGILLVAQVVDSPQHASEFVVAGVLAATVFLIPNLLSRATIGMGDVKLMLLLGVGLGWGVIGAVVIASFALFPFALATIIRGGLSARKNALPFGPFLALGALVVLVIPRLLGLGGA